MKKRLDVELVDRGLVQSRERAKVVIMEGLVYVNGQKSDKAGTPVKEDDRIEVRGETLRYVSRGGKKLEKAMQVFPVGAGRQRHRGADIHAVRGDGRQPETEYAFWKPPGSFRCGAG